MISFDKPIELHGAQLCEELEAVGIIVDKEKNPSVDGDGVLWLDIASKDTQKAQDVLNAHIPKPRPEPTVAEKLASVGLSLDDLKTALGLA
jgi:hypothetical protein